MCLEIPKENNGWDRYKWNEKSKYIMVDFNKFLYKSIINGVWQKIQRWLPLTYIYLKKSAINLNKSSCDTLLKSYDLSNKI